MGLRPSSSTRTLGLVAVIVGIALPVSGCGNESVAPGGAAGLSLDLAQLAAGARAAGITTDSILVVLRRAADSSLALSRTYPDGLLGEVTGTRVVRADIPLRVSPEDFLLHLELRDGGTVYYALDSRVTVLAGVAIATPALSLAYVGPGKDADSLAFILAPPVILPGDSVLAAALIFEQGRSVVGVPVAYESSDTSLVRVRPAGLGVAWLVAAAPSVGSATITAIAPNGLRQTAALAVLAPPARLEKTRGRGIGFP